MSQFPGLLFSDMPAMKPVGWKRQYEMLKPLAIQWLGGHITVPVGFIHNGPSIPDRLRGIVFYTHRLLRPSIVHDYLYSGWGSANGWTRKDADKLFLEGLVIEGVWWGRRRIMWLSVRAGGWIAWSKS